MLNAKRVCKDLEIKNLGEYHDLHLKSDNFKNFRKVRLKIYHVDPSKFRSAPILT